jgi:hypothetical protein
VSAAHAALGAHSAQQLEAMDHMNASVSSFPSFSMEMSYSGATEGNTSEDCGSLASSEDCGSLVIDWATSGSTVRIEVKYQDLRRELIRSFRASDGGAAHSNFEISRLG